MADTFKTLEIALQANETGNIMEDLQERIDIIRHKLKFIENKPTVVCMEQLAPPVIAGDWLPEAIAIAGGTPIIENQDNTLAGGVWEQAVLADPDIMVMALRGWSIDETLSEISALFQLPGFAGLKAVKNNRIYIADGKRFYSDGSGIVDTIEMFAEMINPKQFIFGYEGDEWIKFAL